MTRYGSVRGISTVVGVVTMVAVAVALAATVGAVVLTFGISHPGPTTVIALRATAGDDCVALHHRAGDVLDVEHLRIEISVGGTPLAHQPPVPFFAAEGFESGPTGPFNSASDDRWTAGETAGLRIATTNAPTIDPGDRVQVTVYQSGIRVATLLTTARRGRCRGP